MLADDGDGPEILGPGDDSQDEQVEGRSRAGRGCACSGSKIVVQNLVRCAACQRVLGFVHDPRRAKRQKRTAKPEVPQRVSRQRRRERAEAASGAREL
jgi:hypothetical protein